MSQLRCSHLPRLHTIEKWCENSSVILPSCTTAVPSKTLHANCCTTVGNWSLQPRASVATTPHSHLFRAALSIAPLVPPLPDSSTVIPCVPTATAAQHSTFQTPSLSPPRSPSPATSVASLSAVHVPGVHTMVCTPGTCTAKPWYQGFSCPNWAFISSAKEDTCASDTEWGARTPDHQMTFQISKSSNPSKSLAL